MTTQQLVPMKPAVTAPSSFTPVRGGLLQRKCVCGETPGLSGECAEFEKERTTLQRKANDQSVWGVGVVPLRIPFMQRKLTIGASNHPLEREAERVADQVLAAAAHPAVSDAPPEIRRFTAHPTGQANTVPASVDRVLVSPGRPLDPALQRDMGQRFGHDFARVRVHSDTAAQQSAREVNAHAYTVGHNIVFGAGQFAPGTNAGQRLIAHELTHVVQQAGAGGTRLGQSNTRRDRSSFFASTHRPSLRIARAGRTMLSRATVSAGNVTAEIDYGDLINISPSDFLAAIQSRYATHAGRALDPAVVAQISAFTSQQREWVLFGLDILAENTTQAPGLDRGLAFQRIVDRAPNSATRGRGTSGFAFEREVLTVSGWFEQAISGGLAALSASDQSVIDPLLNPPPAPSAPPGGTLDLATFRTELPILTRARLDASSHDPANWPGTRAQPLGQVQAVGAVIQEQARSFFRPFAETARDNRWLAAWQYSSNISSVTTDPAGSPAPVSLDDRLSLLRNRASGAGWDDSNGPSLFSRTNFDPDRDGAAFETVIAALEANPTVRAQLERQYRHTGHLERPSLRVAISTEVSSAIPECETRWRTIRTLCHELLHSLAHADFVSASSGSPRFPNGVAFSQVLVEGCAEVLGVQLFNDLRQRASTDGALRGLLTQGVTGTCNPPTTPATPAYRAAGSNAETIRARVGDQRFRSAYFHGRVSLIGL